MNLKVYWSQFHYGSIKTKLIESFQFEEGTSQFHYGSIKTKSESKSQDSFDKSQFHYGSIKTYYWDGSLGSSKGLNSTMVRLKLI